MLKLIRQKRRTWKKLSPKAISLFLQAMFLLPLVALFLSVFGLQFTQAALKSLSSGKFTEPSLAQVPQIRQTIQMVRIATRYQQRWVSCLKKSLVLWYLLRRQGVAAELQIGVRIKTGVFQAHAWVQYQGYILGDRQNIQQDYTSFNSLNSQLS
ncbi:MAG: lasso peptide biosynthesis B2 protein [Oscillatoria sp. PMC 1068.18]|nr:lasso peptide biosynthesis B2 protein [Oscillatoria sp. PMC 1076.18]MEC4990299.1 lasso peptide biosynthesis B2 protein [Oscillatoria sp. PMC 1068.18]